jgi:hypothetical protein
MDEQRRGNRKQVLPMDAVLREHVRELDKRADRVRHAIEEVRIARAEEERARDAGTVGEEYGRTQAKRNLAELAEYHALRDYFTAGEVVRESLAGPRSAD